MAAAGGIVLGAVLSASGGPPDRPPFAAARGFTLAAVVPGQPPAVLAAVPGRPVLLTFFAAWCAPCATELPLVERLSRTWAGGAPDAPVVVGVDEQDQRPDGPDLVRRAGVTFPTGFDHDGSVGRSWLLDGLPVTVLIAADGRVLAYHRGQVDQAGLDALARRLTAAPR